MMLALTLSGCGGGGGGSSSSDGGSDETSARTIFSDSFEDTANWTFVDDTGIGENWNVVNGRLNQSTSLEDQDYDSVFDSTTSYHLGTYALLDDPTVSGVTNYRFSVDIYPLPDNSTSLQGNDVGIMFGYEDGSNDGPNYYRVSMNARYGFTRLEKRSNGVFETLKVNARGYVDGQPLTMTVEVNGSTLVVWIDGDPVFAERDTDMLSGTVALYCQDNASFDNARMTENPTDALVVLSSPLAYSVALTPDDGTTLNVVALVLNRPTGGYVEFSLDDVTRDASDVSGNRYAVQFDASDGNHTVEAVLRNADGTRADIDINSTVGTGGDYYITVGDSITNGYGDDDDSNNDSEDGRTISRQGYQAVLADFLTTDTDLPQIVFNEGIPAEMASDLVARIDSILDRHPGANKVLLMIGTNDAGVPIAAGTFGVQVESVATTIVADGKRVWLAETLPTRDNAGMNAMLTLYNDQIRAIAGGDDILLGPDLYDAFFDDSFYSDSLHPNDAGYELMADEWAAALP